LCPMYHIKYIVSTHNQVFNSKKYHLILLMWLHDHS